MSRMNLLFTLTSLSVVLVAVERFSFTTRVLLQPYGFLRLHELVQLTVLIPLTVIVPALIFREVSRDFSALRSREGKWLFLAFVIGTYFYATGNGLHEMASAAFNEHCDANAFTGDLCGGLFFNDFYTGNTMFFAGALLMNTSLLAIESRNPDESSAQGSPAALVLNAAVYAVTVLAYAGLDRSPVGLVYAVGMLLVAGAFFLKVRQHYRLFPFTTYSALVYALGGFASLVVRIFL
ncbi:hypothetical protein LN042_15535 [Kitasatospora sp. RB6PN24]|uniref:hypothetical protein n=1 Tax=Kitasatospora humi TaxID=2893891 RepID=UPI001E52E9F7|nr:hypothetical protein [Kitasatospora humi]MCC9308482.1 hypothetical protein [Kitasatospora humi]